MKKFILGYFIGGFISYIGTNYLIRLQLLSKYKG